MSKSTSVQSFACGRKVAAMVACGVLLSAAGVTQAAPSAIVAGIEPTRVADLVLLKGGFDSGLRQGMVCRVTRGSTEVAEILLVDLRPTVSAALIVSVAPKQSIRAGDVASIKVQKS